ncbi:MAG: V-type ATPase subunit [Treponema sp.]|jgi:vacuolar-type H+-ATPase subunit C/Vma6|nr:V-type ATPase subunit [Treponema sp.]
MMIRAGERSYVYAKACGIVGKSFVGRRISALRPVTRLSELDRLIFSGAARELPERELLPDLERRLLERSVKSIISIVNCFKNPPELLVRLLRVYEYSDLKTALALVNSGENPLEKKFVFTGLGGFGSVKFGAFPDLSAMLEGTEFAFLLDKKGRLRTDFDGSPPETILDNHYYRRLWESLLKLKKSDRRAAERIILEEISLRNCSWVLRLRTYYGMRPEELALHLIRPGETKKPGAEGPGPFSAEIEDALKLPLDSRGEWERWRRAEFLNPEGVGPWRVDPRYFQNAASEYLYRLALRSFRRRPFSIDTAFCFIKLKQFEEDLLTSDAEGLGLGMSSKDVFGILEANL